MKKVSLGITLISVSVTLLLTQIIILQYLIRKDDVNYVSDPAWETLSEVASIAYKEGVPLVLADPVIFRNIQKTSKHASNTLCHILCFGQKITHFATISSLSTQSQKSSLIDELKAKGYKVLVSTGFDPVLLQHGLNVPIPLNIFFASRNHVVHVYLLYERPAKFWWVGALNFLDKQHVIQELSLDESDLALSSNESALEKVEIVPAAVDGVKTYLPLKLQVFVDYGVKNHFLECNYTQAKHFHAMHGRDESDEAEVFRTKAWKLLSKAKRLLDQLNVPFWLSSGTCLGFFRECGFIPYSKDVDLGIWITDFKPEIISLFSSNDLPLTHVFGKIKDSYELSFRDGDIKLDLFFFYEEKDSVWNGGTQARTGKKFKYMFPKFDLCWTEFLELKVRVPCQTETYIKSNYGSKWFEPVKIWDWKKSPPNVFENGQWPYQDWPEVMQLWPLPEQT